MYDNVASHKSKQKKKKTEGETKFTQIQYSYFYNLRVQEINKCFFFVRTNDGIEEIDQMF